PYFVAVGSAVRLYASYSRGQFVPHFPGSTSFSVTSTSFTKACFASPLRSAMLTASAAAPIATTAKTPVTRAMRRPRFFRGWVSFDMRCSPSCGSGWWMSAEVTDRGVAADAGDALAVRHLLDEVGV